MAQSNESQGLKIAVAAFVSLTVILAVTSYFLYSNWDQTAAQLKAAQEKTQQQSKSASDALTQYDEMRKELGSRGEEYEAVKTEIKNAKTKAEQEIQALAKPAAEAIEKVQAAGSTSPTLEEVKTTAETLYNGMKNEPNKNYISTVARLTDLLKNQVKLTTTLAANYVELRRGLESANTVNKQQVDVLDKAVKDSKADVEAEQTKHTEARQELLAKVDQYQTDINNKATEIATLTTQLRQLREETGKQQTQMLGEIRELQDAKAKTENVLDRPDGVVTFVDYKRSEVRTNISFGMGARPQMTMSIFDSGSAGLPTERPKGSIELIYVSNRYSLARIVKTFSPIDPIKPGDLVYSPAWSPNEPMRFALIGKIDVNRDGKDDRADLIRLIEAAGGIVDYDLPPPFAGKEKGKITPKDAWYVVDERMPLRDPGQKTSIKNTEDDVDFVKKRSSAIREARDNGVRPMPIGRLLGYLGYDFAAPITGRPEAIDTQSLKDLARPRKDATKAKIEAEPKEEAAPKEEKPKEEAMEKDAAK